jgi:cob(I)alamin adenosyltransferase
MKIYTKKGDAGQTSLFGGKRVLKSSLRIDAYGTVDELNSILGLSITYSPGKKTQTILKDLQHKLFILGADLATPLEVKKQIRRITHADIEMLETIIDELEEVLPPLKNFILPGGNSCGATIHMARTVCRRAERAAIACKESEESPVSDDTIIFLNRLSDLLFVLARFENHRAGMEETVWKVDGR